MNWKRPVFVLVSLGMLLLAAATPGCEAKESGRDSNTNFLTACTSSSDCGASECLCGVCTLTCDQTDACAEVPGTQCVAPSSAPAACNLEPPGACLPTCDVGSPCELADGPGRCVGGVCLAVATPDAGGAAGAGSGGSGGAGGSSSVGGKPTGGSGGAPACKCEGCFSSLQRCTGTPACLAIADCAEASDCHGEECFQLPAPDGGAPDSGPCRVEIDQAGVDAYNSFLGAEQCVAMFSCQGHLIENITACVD